ncbi:MAG: hypothetical protein LUI85_02815 [Bacteroides sp.]|nr:hypothetical protein [Bacteroides sp.]
MNFNDLKIGMTVYHRDVYNHREPLKVVGITETEIKLQGDFSGGTHNVIQEAWLPIKGTSVVYNYDYKNYCREQAVIIEELAKPIINRNQNNTVKTMFDLLDMVFKLTNNASLNGVL